MHNFREENFYNSSGSGDGGGYEGGFAYQSAYDVRQPELQTFNGPPLPQQTMDRYQHAQQQPQQQPRSAPASPQRAAAPAVTHPPSPVPYVDVHAGESVPAASASASASASSPFTRAEFVRITGLALIVTLGMAIHWVLVRPLDVWIEDADDALQRTLVAIGYPVAIVLGIMYLRGSKR